MIFLTGDVHLGKSLRNAKLFKDDSYTAFYDMVDKIIDYPGIDKDLIMAGDICENNYITGRSLEVLADGIDRLNKNDIYVYTIMGNHDFGDRSIPVTQGAVNLGDTLHTVQDKTVYGLDYHPPELLKKKFQDVPECDLLVLHQSFQHLLGFEGAYDLSLYDIPEQVKNVLCGDIHIINQETVPGGGFFLSPGSLHPNKVDENNKHGFWAWDTEPEFIEVRTRPIVRGYVDSEEKFNQVHKELEEIQSDMSPIVELKYKPEYYGKIETLFKKFSAYFDTTGIVDGDVQDISGASLTSTMVDKLPETVDTDNKEQYDFCYKLLTEDADKIISEKCREKEVEVEE